MQSNSNSNFEFTHYFCNSNRTDRLKILTIQSMEHIFNFAYDPNVKPNIINDRVVIDEFLLMTKKQYYTNYDDRVRNELKKSNNDNVEKRFHELEIQRCLYLQAIIESLDMRQIDIDYQQQDQLLTNEELNKQFNYVNELNIRRKHMSKYYKDLFTSYVVSGSGSFADTIRELSDLTFEHYTITNKIYDSIIKRVIVVDALCNSNTTNYLPSKHVNQMLQLFDENYRRYCSDNEVKLMIEYDITHVSSLIRF